MKYDPAKHHRRSIRLTNYDYSQPGAYFITVVTRDREILFGDVVDGESRLNDTGRMVQEVWHDLPKHYAEIERDSFVVMPNHVHGIVALHDDRSGRAGLKPAPTKTRPGLPEIVRAFKTFSARSVNRLRGTQVLSVWQRNYYEHVIRVETELARIREYIKNNPLQWELDRENPLRRLDVMPEVSDPWEV